MQNPTTPEEYFVPELWEELGQLPTTATLAEVIDHVNLVTGVVNELVERVMGVKPSEELPS